MRYEHARVLLLALTVLCGSAPAAAESGHAAKAKAFLTEGRHLDAAKEYEAAWKETGIPAYLFHGARALEAAGDPEAAVRFYRRYLVEDPEAVNRAEVEARIAVLSPSPAGTAAAKPGRAPGTAVPTIASTPTPRGVVLRLRSARIMPAKADGRVWDGLGRANPGVVSAMMSLAAGTATGGWSVIADLAGRGLLSATEMPDPFVTVLVDGSLTYATKFVRDTLDPIWDASRDLPVTDLSDVALDFSVWDKDISENDPIGTCSVPRVLPPGVLEAGSWVIPCHNQVYEIELSVRRIRPDEVADDPLPVPDLAHGADKDSRRDAPDADVTAVAADTKCSCEKDGPVIVTCTLANSLAAPRRVKVTVSTHTKSGTLGRGERLTVVPSGRSSLRIEAVSSGAPDCSACGDAVCGVEDPRKK